MDLYLNDNQKYKVIINGIIYNLHLYSAEITGERIISSDNLILQDIYGVYLKPKKEE